MKNIEIKSAKYLSEYKVSFVFTDNTKKTVDFYPFLKDHKSPHVTPYKNLSRFKKFEIENGSTISWGDYDMCFRIESLYSGYIPPPDMDKVKEMTIKYFGKKKAEKMFEMA